MSDDLVEEKKGLPLAWILAGAGGLLLAGLLLVATLGGTPGENGPSGVPATVEENGLEKARQTLTRSGTADSCQAALQHIHTYLGQENVPEHVPVWEGEDRAWLIKELGLSKEEQQEVGSTSYTTLDAAHLEACLLLRDAARTLVRKEDRKTSRVGLEQARAAFAWVARQVRLQSSQLDTLPPSYVLVRGWGTALERALVYLALLEQMGHLEGSRSDLLGCLLMIPGEGGKLRLWACGVVVPGSKDVYLFDPRLGLPLPGPRGEGVATLEQARSQEDVLGQLPHGDKYRYDVTRAQAREARPLLVCSLSSLAPRMRYLQETLLAPTVKVRLAVDPRQAQKALHAAAGADVSFWPNGSRLLRRFLPPSEGGVDTPQGVPLASLGGYTSADDPTVISLGRKQLYQFGLVPWHKLPHQLRDPQRFPYNVGLGDRVRSIFSAPFRHSLQNHDGPRHLLLRGQQDKAVEALMDERGQLEQVQKQRASAGDIGPEVDAWVDKALKPYATLVSPRSSPEQREEAGAEVKELWEKASALILVLGGAIADARLPEIAYAIALCKHEQAEQLQGRAGDQGGQAWHDALDWWNTFLAGDREHPARSAAQRRRAEVLLALGDRAAARTALTELAGSLEGLEKVAVLYQAEQLRPKK